MNDLFTKLKKIFVGIPPEPKVENFSEQQARHRQNALAFAKQQQRLFSAKQREKDLWQIRFGKQQAAELNQLSGTEFEKYLAGLLQQLGYLVELTPSTGDYGADLLLSKDGLRIAVQAKCYTGSVGVAAVQEALSGMAYYQCQSAWVITTGNYTNNAIELARQSKVRLINSTEIGKWITLINDTTGR